MEKSMSDILSNTLLICFFFIAIISLGFSGCIPGEREALLEFKNKLTDPSNRLQSWDVEDVDCCKWYGVICSNLTGHVLELHLRSLSFREYYSYVGDFLYDDADKYYPNYHGKSTFGGEVSSSLLNLKELRYLDLSNNAFGGIPIPKFLGSLGSLRILNLSNAGFGKMIPHELGNLSNLHYLNLASDDHAFLYGIPSLLKLKVDSLDWVSALSLLEFLDLSRADLFQSFNWLKVMNKLPSLQELHLSGCNLFQFPPLPNVNFSSLSILDLSKNLFSEFLIPNWIFGLKNLKVLDLSLNSFGGPQSHHLQNMTSLQKLELSRNDFFSVPKWIFGLTTLITLNMDSNYFEGPIPNDLQNVSLLKELDISMNQFNSSIPEWLYNFRHLELLNLASNSLEGKISASIGSMTSLASLDLSDNVKFDGGIPKSFKKLCNLRSIDFSGTKLGQEFNDIIDILSGCTSNILESLVLSSCELSGQMTNQLGNFKNLIHLGLSNNSISGPIPLVLLELKSLRILFLGRNKLGGTVPAALGGLAKLLLIDISYNSLEGVVSEMHFANLTKLTRFDGSMNQLILRVGSDWIPPFLHLQSLKLRQWEIGPQFPSWLRTLKNLEVLDLSNSRISTSIPNWFWNSSFPFVKLNLSHNQIHGIIPDMNLNLEAIDLSSNNLDGSLPRITTKTMYVDVSQNSFSGSISHFICHKMDGSNNMYVLDLGNNLLTGEIPDCWSNWTHLLSLRLSNNNFSGNIPKSIGNLARLYFLHLRNNSLSGEIPKSLQSCGSLITLDMGENELIGYVPNWFKFPSMSILILGANKFHGKIPKEICHLTSLQILDLSYNSLSGTIPNCINSFTFMATTGSPYGPSPIQLSTADGGSPTTSEDDAWVMMKGRIVNYNTILKYVKIMDFSSNKLSGEIPKEITRLVTLQSLNLSNNFLSGKIPEEIGIMRGLEVLDISRNRLNGRIPQSMTELTFLSMLNVSYNNLSGHIPTSTQLQSFPSSSFIGNEGLWGPPLLESNTRNDSVPSSGENENREQGDEVDWGLYVSMAIGFIVGFWSILCPLVLNRQWRHAYYLFLDRLWNKIWWHFRWCRGVC